MTTKKIKIKCKKKCFKLKKKKKIKNAFLKRQNQKIEN